MKRALVAGAVGLGLGGAGAAINADETDRGSDEAERERDGADRTDEHVHHPELVLVFVDDYHPEVTFRPIDRLPQRVVNDILEYPADEGDPVVANPTDYNGYLVVRRPDLVGEYAFAFVNRRTLQQDQRYRFTDDVVFFDERVSLVSASITIDNRADESSAETTTPTDETTATINETTTREVIVEPTETDDDD